MKKLYCFLIAFSAIFVYSCTNSQFTNPSQYIRYAESVNGGGSGSGGKVVYYTLAINTLGDGDVRVNDKEYEVELKFQKGAKVKIEALAAFGNQFQAWRGSISSDKKLEEIVMDSDKSIVASFIDPTDKKILFINIGRNGSVEITDDKGTKRHDNNTGTMMTITNEYDALSSVKLKAIPKDDTFVFAGWSGSKVSADLGIDLPLDSITTIFASFDPDEKVLAISTTEWGYAEVTVNNEPAIKYSDVMYIQKGSKVKIEAKEKDNNTRKYKFVRWSGSRVSENKVITINNFNSDVSLIAEFEQVMRKLTIGNPTLGHAMEYRVNGDLYMGATDYPIDSTLSIDAIEKYYPFVSWSGDASGNSKTVSVLLDDNKTINASFETGVFDVYDNPDLNGYSASKFNTWGIRAVFDAKETPTYTYPLANMTWSNASTVKDIPSLVYRGAESTVGSGFTKVTIKNMNYYLYKGENPYMIRDKPSDDYNKNWHANRLKRFYFYRFTGDGYVLGSKATDLDNALCAVDTYTKLAYVYAVPGKWKSIVGQKAPEAWYSIEVTNSTKHPTTGEVYKFYEYDPVGYVPENGNVVLFKSFKDIQSAAAGKGETPRYFPKEPSGGTATIDFASLNLNGGNRSPYLE